MDLLASAYDSDQESRDSDHGERDEPVPVPLPAKAPVAVPTSRANPPPAPESKPKRKLDISFLPQAIQDALLRGDTADSDDDDNGADGGRGAAGNLRRKGIKSNQAESRQSGGDPLLKVLPAPKNAQPIPFHSMPKPPPAAASLPRDSYSSSSSSTSTPVVTTTRPAATAATSATVTPSSASPSPPAAASVHSWASLSNPFALPSQAHLPQDAPMQSNGGISTAAMPAPDSMDRPYGAPADPRHSAVYSQPDEELDIQDASHAVNRRKREREIEQQLMAGDMSALKDARVATIDTQFDWNARNYMDNQLREAMIRKAYAGDGGAKLSLQQPNRLENRKHQLTSLAQKAAETEIALLEARGQRSKTKSQTQSKYGW